MRRSAPMPTGADARRIVRLWKLVLLIMRARMGLTQSRLASECGVTRMTVHRDLVALEAAGLPIERRRVNGELRLFLRTTELPALVLDADQVQALAVARRLLDPLIGTRVLRAYDDVLVRLGRKPSPLPDDAAHRALTELRATIESAMERRLGLRILYIKEREARLEVRMIEPLGWRFVRGVLNLLAFDAGRGARRSFQANRIIEAHVLETSVREPAATGDTEAYFAQADQLETLPIVMALSGGRVAAKPARPRPLQRRVGRLREVGGRHGRAHWRPRSFEGPQRSSRCRNRALSQSRRESRGLLRRWDRLSCVRLVAAPQTSTRLGETE